MKFTVKSTDIQKKLDNLHKIAKQKTVTRALDHIMIDVSDDMLTFTASDYEVTQISKVIPESVSETGSICVLADTFVETIKKLSDCIITVSEQKNIIVIKSKSGTFKIPSMSSEDFPITRNPNAEYEIEIPSFILASAINKVAFASAPESERDFHPERCGVFIDFKSDKTTVVATDSMKCAAIYIDPYSPVEQSVLLSKRMATNIISLFGQSDTTLTVTVDDRDIKVESAEHTLYGKLIEAKFPPYHLLLNNSVTSILTTKTDDLINAIDRVMLYCPFNSSAVRLSCNDNTLKISGENIDFSLSAEDDVDCNIKYGGGEFSLNGKWMQETLSRIKTTDVEISFGDRPMVYFNPVETNDNYIFVVAKYVI